MTSNMSCLDFIASTSHKLKHFLPVLMAVQLCQTAPSLILVLLSASLVLSFHPITVQDHLLVGHVVQTLEVDWLDCIHSCQENSECVSYNYHKSVTRLCQLNNGGVENLCEGEKSLVYEEGVVFQQLKPVKVRRRRNNTIEQ